MKPSILVPTYNRSERLRRALDSIAAQTLPCEVVVVNGGSQDQTRVTILDSYSTGLDIRAVHFDPPGPGFLPTWYTAAALASGDVCHYQLDDDWVDPTFMERTTALLTDDVSMVLTQATVHFDDGRPDQINLAGMPTESGKLPSQAVAEYLLKIPLTITPACATMRRADVLDWLPVGRIPNAPRRTNCADCYMMLSTIVSRPWVQWIAEPLAHLGAHDDGFTMERLAGPDAGADLVAQYSEVKAAWMRHHQAPRP